MTPRYPVFVGLCALAMATLPGCGTTTQPFVSIGQTQSSTPGATGAATVTRLDFYVGQNTLQKNSEATTAVSSFIQAQVQNSANSDFIFQIIGYQASDIGTNPTGPIYVEYAYNSAGQPIATDGKPVANNPYGTPLSASTLASITNAVGSFNITTYLYTPPTQIVADPFNSNKPLTRFALKIIPADPSLVGLARSIELDLNLILTITPQTSTITANTAQAPTLYTEQLTMASGTVNGVLPSSLNPVLSLNPVPGDGFSIAHGQPVVTWTCVDTNKTNYNSLLQSDGKATVTFTAPHDTSYKSPFTVTATSTIQPSVFTTATITVKQSTATIGFQ